jgi:hypothetical protein
MTTREVTLAVALLTLGIPGLAASQGLGETAARERERREKESQGREEEAAPVYTNDDLAVFRPPGEESDDEDASGDDAGSSSEASTRRSERPRPSDRVRGRDDPDRARRQEVSRAQTEVDRIEARIRALNGRLNPMSRDYVYGEASNVDAANEEIRIREELRELEQELRQARRDLSEVSSRGGGDDEPRDDVLE